MPRSQSVLCHLPAGPHIIFPAVLIDFGADLPCSRYCVSNCGCKRIKYVGVGDLAVGSGASYWSIQDHTFHCFGLLFLPQSCVHHHQSVAASSPTHVTRWDTSHQKSPWIFILLVRSHPCADIRSLLQQESLCTGWTQQQRNLAREFFPCQDWYQPPPQMSLILVL